MTADQIQQTDDEGNVTHESILPIDGARPIPLRSETRTTPALFYSKMRNRLRSIGVNMDELDFRTDREPDEQGKYPVPPCFKLNGADFAEWLTMASQTDMVPLRYDLPGEPNYCHDCTPVFKSHALKCGACLFPNTRFEVRRDAGEKETVGVSRSNDVPPEQYVVYQQMVVPLSSLDERIQAYVRARRLQKVDYDKLPKAMQEAFVELKGPKTEPAQ